MFKIFFIILFSFQTVLFSLEIIGNFETITLNDFNASNVEAKIDTGAIYSALHCSYIKEVNGTIVEFSPLTLNQVFQKKIIKIVNIKSSNGQIEQRFIIDSIITINNRSYPILFSLTKRDKMQYKILIGTDFLKNRFLVDVGKQILKD